MTSARQAIAEINNARLLIPTPRLTLLAKVISTAAVCGDHDARNYLWLLQWQPNQLMN